MERGLSVLQAQVVLNITVVPSLLVVFSSGGQCISSLVLASVLFSFCSGNRDLILHGAVVCQQILYHLIRRNK